MHHTLISKLPQSEVENSVYIEKENYSDLAEKGS